MPATQTAPKLVSIKTNETSGVAHPAHEIEGWMLLKSKDGKAASVFEAFRAAGSSTPGGTMPADTPEQLLAKEREGAKVWNDAVEALLVKERDDAVIWNTAVEAELKKEKDRAATLASALAGTGVVVPTAPDEFADLPADVATAMRKERDRHDVELKKERDRVDVAEKELAKQREERDTEREITLAKSRQHLAYDFEKVGKLLRKARTENPELAGELDKLLDGLEEQAKTQVGFLKSAGVFTPPGEGSAQAQLDAMAETILAKSRETDKPMTKEKAIVEAALANRDLAAQAAAEQAGD